MTEIKEHWHLRKEVNLSHLFLTISLAIGATTAWMDVKEDVNANRSELRHQKELQQKSDDELKKDIKGIKDQTEKIEDKIDQLIRRELDRNHVR
jgi:hypothetical protein